MKSYEKIVLVICLFNFITLILSVLLMEIFDTWLFWLLNFLTPLSWAIVSLRR